MDDGVKSDGSDYEVDIFTDQDLIWGDVATNYKQSIRQFEKFD